MNPKQEQNKEQSAENLRFIVKNLARILSEIVTSKARLPFRDSFSYEPSPESIQLKLPSKQGPAISSSKEKEDNKAKLPVNFTCSFCKPRLYPVRRYFRIGTKPLLCLYYNAPFGTAAPLLPDRSQSFLFGKKETDEIFERMLKALAVEKDTLYYQEYPACHFDHSRSSEADWQHRAQACLPYLLRTLEVCGIQKALLCGNAATALLGQERASRAAKEASVFPYHFKDQAGSFAKQIACVVIRSPAALLALEEQRIKAQRQKKLQTQDSGRQESDSLGAELERRYAKLLAQEKAIKAQTLAALRALIAA